VRSCFFASAVLFMLLIPLIGFVAAKVSRPATNGGGRESDPIPVIGDPSATGGRQVSPGGEQGQAGSG